MTWVMALLTSKWTRELVLVALIVLLLVRYYFRYINAVRSKGLRSQRRRTHNVLVNTRAALAVLVIALVAVVAYDRILPHWGLGARTTTVATSSSHHAKAHATKHTAKKSSRKKKSSSSKPVDATRAVAIVKGYYKRHPNDNSNSGATSYQFVQKGTDDYGAQVYEVGGYGAAQDGSQQLLHMFYVHADGKFNVEY